MAAAPETAAVLAGRVAHSTPNFVKKFPLSCGSCLKKEVNDEGTESFVKLTVVGGRLTLGGGRCRWRRAELLSSGGGLTLGGGRLTGEYDEPVEN